MDLGVLLKVYTIIIIQEETVRGGQVGGKISEPMGLPHEK